jgi:hypothetical protein
MGATIVKVQERLKQDPEPIGQSESFKVSSLPSLLVLLQ